jgi:hypothetical protein
MNLEKEASLRKILKSLLQATRDLKDLPKDIKMQKKENQWAGRKGLKALKEYDWIAKNIAKGLVIPITGAAVIGGSLYSYKHLKGREKTAAGYFLGGRGDESHGDLMAAELALLGRNIRSVLSGTSTARKQYKRSKEEGVAPRSLISKISLDKYLKGREKKAGFGEYWNAMKDLGSNIKFYRELDNFAPSRYITDGKQTLEGLKANTLSKIKKGLVIPGVSVGAGAAGIGYKTLSGGENKVDSISGVDGKNKKNSGSINFKSLGALDDIGIYAAKSIIE